MVKPEPQKLLRPRFLNSDLNPIRQWFEKHNAFEKPPSGHADMIDQLRCRCSIDNPQCLDLIGSEHFQKLDTDAHLYSTQARLLKMEECKAILSMWSTTHGKLHADSKRGPAEAALKAMTLQVLAWKACMDSYESAAEDFITTLHMLPPARTLQANIVYHGRVRYLCLLSKLTEHFDAVVRLLSSAISTRKCMAKRKSLTECGVYSEFFSGDARGVRPQASVAVAWWVMTWVCSRQASVGFAWWVSCRHPSASCVVCGWVTMPSCIAAPLGDAMDASYDEVAEELHTMHDMNSIDSMSVNAVYAPKQLLEILDLFTRFSVLTHQQIVRLVPPHDHVVSSFYLILQQLLHELPVVAVRLQYDRMRKFSGAHTQYIYVPALNGTACAHFVRLLEAARERPLDPKFSQSALFTVVATLNVILVGVAGYAYDT